jgi:hypothetical protein
MWLRDLAARHDAFAGQLAEPSRQARVPGPGIAGPGTVMAWPWPGEEPLLRPPRPLIRPSARVLERAAGRQADREAGM